MKKQLLTTTALIAAGIVAAAGAAQAQQKAQKPSITVNGYHEQVVGITLDQDRTSNPGGGGDTSTFDVNTESEVHFNGRATLDNGIALRAHWELEGNTNNDQIDETYLIIRGSFGQLTIGSEDNAGHLMVIGYSGSWATGVGQNLTFDSTDFISIPQGFEKSFDSTINDVRLRSGDNDSEKVSYYTPRMAGLQVGVSYIPVFNQDKNSAPALTTDGYHDGYAIGVNYNGKVGPTGFGIAGGYLAANAPDGVNIPDPSAWVVGARVDFGPVRIAGAFKQNIDMRKASDPFNTSYSGEIWDVGVRYINGPHRFSIAYAQGAGEASLANPGDDELNHGVVSYARNLAPGVRWSANLFFADMEGEDAGTADDNNGLAFTTSVRLTF